MISMFFSDLAVEGGSSGMAVCVKEEKTREVDRAERL